MRAPRDGPAAALPRQLAAATLAATLVATLSVINTEVQTQAAAVLTELCQGTVTDGPLRLQRPRAAQEAPGGRGWWVRRIPEC